MRKFNFRKRINIGFAIIFFIMLITSLYSIWQLNNVSKNMQLVYEHPFKVSNAIREVNIDVYKIDRLVRDVRLIETKNQLDSLFSEINQCDLNLNKNHKLIKDQYLGNKKDIDSIFSEIANWKIIQNKIYRLKSENKTDSLIKVIKNENHKCVDHIISHTRVISDFASNKAETTMALIYTQRTNTLFYVFIVLSIVLLIIFLISYIISKSINKPIRKFINEANSIFSLHSFKQDIVINHEEELFNYTIHELKKSYQNIEQQNEEIKSSNEQLINFNKTLEEKVKERTRTLKEKNEEIEAQNEEYLQINEELKEAKEKAEENEVILKQKNEEIEAQNEEYKQVNEELSNAKSVTEENEKRFRSTLDNMMEGCQILGFDWRYMYLNNVADKHNQRPKEELLSKRYMDMWPGIEETNIFKIIKSCMEERHPYHLENEFVFPDGTKGWFDLSIQPVPEGVFILSLDITERKNAELKLQESELLFSTTFYYSPIPVSITDMATEKWVEVNNAFLQVTGYSREEVMGKTFRDINLWKRLDERDKMKNLLLEKGRVINYEVDINKKNGTTGTMLISVEKIDLSGKPCLLIMGNEITQWKQANLELIIAKEKAEKNEELLSTVLNNAPMTIFATDNQGIFTLSDGKQLELVNLKPGDNVGMSAIELYESFPFEEESGIISTGRNVIQRVLNGETINSLSVLRDITFENRMVPLISKDGTIKGLLGVAFDITERKRIEKELVLAKEKAEENERLKSSFLANMSHEIRTPLNLIVGYSEFLSDDNLSKQEKKEYVSLVINNSMRLLELIKNILVLSKLESGQMLAEQQNFNLNKLLDELFEQNKKTVAEKRLKLFVHKETKEHLAIINSNEQLIYQIYTNLLNNARKYSDTGRIDFGYKIVNSGIELFVSDTGIGISKEYLTNLFTRFSQENPYLNRKYDGAGLGLSIVKGIVDLLNGTITVDSEKGKGTTFKVSIPLEKTINKAEFETLHVELCKPKQITLLIVEDDMPSFILFKKQISKNYDCEIIHAVNGYDAIEKVKKYPHITCVLMDLHMPEMDGCEATTKIKSINKNLPVFAVTAAVLDVDRERAFKAGCEEFFSKPVDKENLFKLITKYTEVKYTNISNNQDESSYEIEMDDSGKMIKLLNDKNITLLIVEDDEASFYLLKMQISEEITCKIIHAIKGLSAIEKVKEHPEITCVLMDLHLPGIDGCETTEKIKQIRKDLPIFAVTASTLESDKDKALKAGCDEFFSKPVDREKLYKCILQYVKKKYNKT